MEWKEEFKKTQYNKLAFIGYGAEKWIEQHNKAIETEIIEKLIADIPAQFNCNYPQEAMEDWKQQLRDKWLGK